MAFSQSLGKVTEIFISVFDNSASVGSLQPWLQRPLHPFNTFGHSELLVGPKDLTQRPDLASAPNRNPATRNPLPWDQCRLRKEHFGVSGSRNGQQVDTAVMSTGLWPNIVVDTKGWKLAGMQSGSGFSKNTLLLTLCHLKHHRIFLLIASTPLKCPPEPPNAAFWSLLNVTAASTLHLLVIRRCGV